MESEVKNGDCIEFRKYLMDRLQACYIRLALLRVLYGNHFHVFKQAIKKEIDRNTIERDILENMKYALDKSTGCSTEDFLENGYKYGKQAYSFCFGTFSEDKHGG